MELDQEYMEAVGADYSVMSEDGGELFSSSFNQIMGDLRVGSSLNPMTRKSVAEAFSMWSYMVDQGDWIKFLKANMEELVDICVEICCQSDDEWDEDIGYSEMGVQVAGTKIAEFISTCCSMDSTQNLARKAMGVAYEGLNRILDTEPDLQDAGCDFVYLCVLPSVLLRTEGRTQSFN